MLHYTYKDYIKRYLTSFATGSPLAVILMTLLIIFYSRQKAKNPPPTPQPVKDIVVNISIDSIIEDIKEKDEEKPIPQEPQPQPIPQPKPQKHKPIKHPQKKAPQKQSEPIPQKPHTPSYKVDNEDFSETKYNNTPQLPSRKEAQVVQKDVNFAGIKYNVNIPQKVQNAQTESTNFQSAKYNQNVKINNRSDTEFADEQKQFNEAQYNTKASVNSRSDKAFMDDKKYNLPSANYNPNDYKVQNRSQNSFSSGSPSFKQASYKFKEIKDRLKQIYAQGGDEAIKSSVKNYNIALKQKGADISVDRGEVNGGQVDYSADIAKMDAEIKAERQRRAAAAEAEKRRIAEALAQREREAALAKMRVEPRRATKNPASPAPIYPIEAEIKGMEGVVSIRLTVLPSGDVNGVRIVQSSGYSILDNEALLVVKNDWSFFPATDEYGKRVSDVIDIDVTFELSE